jgi:ankyrin repeat protein
MVRKTTIMYIRNIGFLFFIPLLMGHTASYAMEHILLHEAVYHGISGVVEEYIRCGVEVNICNGGKSLVHIAVSRNHKDIVELLLKAGADSNKKCNNDFGPLHEACALGNRGDILKLLIEAGADVHSKDKNGLTPLFLAAGRCGPYALYAVELLIKAGAHRHKASAQAALHHAALRGTAQVVKRLIRAGIDPNKKWQNTSILHRALENDSPSVMAELIINGAYDDLDGIFPSCTETAVLSKNSILTKKNCFIVQSMEKEAPINALERRINYRGTTSNHYNELYKAIIARDINRIKKLLQRKDYLSCLNQQDKELGGTLLMYATALELEEIVELLLGYGASPLRVTHDGRTVFTILLDILENPALFEEHECCQKIMMWCKMAAWYQYLTAVYRVKKINIKDIRLLVFRALIGSEVFDFKPTELIPAEIPFITKKLVALEAYKKRKNKKRWLTIIPQSLFLLAINNLKTHIIPKIS